MPARRIPHQQARRRLVMLSAYAGSSVTLTRKILERPRLLARIAVAIGDPSTAHLSCFNATADERSLALRLGIPLYACDPALAALGSKSGSRETFRAAGIDMPAGSENLRKGGTTHTFQALQYLTNGHYEEATGEFRLSSGETRGYCATDNLQHPAYRQLTPEDLIDIAVEYDLHFDQTRLEGVAFNLIGALSEVGKLGVVSIAARPERAKQLHARTVAVLDRETGVADRRSV